MATTLFTWLGSTQTWAPAMADNNVPLRVFSHEEIEIFLSGDRREIDRLLLHGLNNIACILIPRMRREDDISRSLGNAEEVAARVDWINSQIDSQKNRSRMMQKVADSSVSYAVLGFLGFIIYATWESVVAAIKFHGIIK